MGTATSQPTRSDVLESTAPVRRTTSSRFCAFGVGDAELRDVAFGSLSPILVAFVGEGDPAWESIASLLETVASDRLRCLLVDPVVCPTSAPLLGHAGGVELLLVVRGSLAHRIDVATPPAGVADMVSATLAPKQ